MLTYIIGGYFFFSFSIIQEAMDPKEKNNSITVNHDKVTSRKRKGKAKTKRNK